MDECIANFTTSCQADDTKQELFCVLLEKPPSLIIQLHEQGTLFYYSIIIIRNLTRTSKRKQEVCELEDIPEREHHVWSDKLLTALQTLDASVGYPYFTELIKTVAHYGSQHKAAKAIRIPVSSLRRDVLVVRKYLKSQVCY